MKVCLVYYAICIKQSTEVFYVGSTNDIDSIHSIQVYLCSAFHDTNRCKAALQKMLSFYIIFSSRLLVVTMAEMYSKNHAVSYKLHIIKQTVNTINSNDYVLLLNFAIASKRCD